MGGKDFLIGMVAATAAFSAAWVFLKTFRRSTRISKKRAKRELRNNSLATILGQAMDMSTTSPAARRAMIVIASGEELKLDYIETKLLKFLGFVAGDILPRTVYDLLPQSMIQQHRLWVSSAIRAQCLPPRLQHPLRSVEVRHASGFFVRMDLKITWSSEDTKEPIFHLLFAECSGQYQYTYPTIEDVRVGDQVEHEEAVVVLLDIVEFTKECSQLTAVEVLSWMKHVRHAIEDVMIDNGLRLIETRGDNYLAIATPEDGWPSPATRAVDFATRTSRAVAELRGTRIRVGLAQGHVTVATLRCMGRREVLCLFGDVVNVAGRLEQAADPDHVLVGEAVARAYAAERGLPPPPVRAIAAKGKPDGVRCARLEWRRPAFVDHGWPPPPLRAADAAEAATVISTATADLDKLAASSSVTHFQLPPPRQYQRHHLGLSMLELELPRSVSSDAALGRGSGGSGEGGAAPLGPSGGLQRLPSARGGGPHGEVAKYTAAAAAAAVAAASASAAGDDEPRGGGDSGGSSASGAGGGLRRALAAAARVRRWAAGDADDSGESGWETDTSDEGGVQDR